MPATGARRPTACCEKYCDPTPKSPDHSSTGASGLNAIGTNASSFSQDVMLPSRVT